jgi:hypothetical protein
VHFYPKWSRSLSATDSADTGLYEVHGTVSSRIMTGTPTFFWAVSVTGFKICLPIALLSDSIKIEGMGGISWINASHEMASLQGRRDQSHEQRR